MKNILLLILFLSGTLVSPAQKTAAPLLTSVERQATSWKEFSSADGGFSIEFPGTPKHTTEIFELPNSQIELQIYNLRTFVDYSVVYADYPIPANDPEAAKKALDNAAKGAAVGANLELAEIKEISLGGFPGRYLKEKMPVGEIMRAKIYLVGRRMYQISITIPVEKGTTSKRVKFYEEIADKFLNSFKILKKEEATKVNIAPNAPSDKPVQANAEQLQKFETAIKPYIEKAKKTYPQAKERFQKGLPAKHTFFITTRLKDKQGRFEQVFVAVKEIKNGIVIGLISSDVQVVSGYKQGDGYTFPESELIDWTITAPDGTEEGNFVGKFLDTYQPQ